MEQYSGVHLREGRSLGQPNLRNSGHLQTRSGRPSSGYRPIGKGKTHKAYTDAWYEEDVYYEEDQDQEEDFNEASYPAFGEEPAPGYLEDPETSYPSPKQLPSTALRNSRSPQKLDMLYSYNWQQPLARLKAKAKVSPRKARAKVRARSFVVT